MMRSDDDDGCSERGDGDEDEDLRGTVHLLRERLIAYDSEVVCLRAQLAVQRDMMASLQATMLMASEEDGTNAEEHHQQHHRQTAADPPLVEACRSGDVEMVGLLLDRADRADHHRSSDQELLATALQVACQHARHEVVALLLARCEAMGRIGMVVHADHDSALLWACRMGDETAVRLLLGAGADAGALGGCPLRLAVRGGFHGVARLLLTATVCIA